MNFSLFVCIATPPQPLDMICSSCLWYTREVIYIVCCVYTWPGREKAYITICIVLSFEKSSSIRRSCATFPTRTISSSIILRLRGWLLPPHRVPRIHVIHFPCEGVLITAPSSRWQSGVSPEATKLTLCSWTSLHRHTRFHATTRSWIPARRSNPRTTPQGNSLYRKLHRIICTFTTCLLASSHSHTHSQPEDTRSWKISKVHTTWRPPPHPSRTTFAPVGSERIFTRLSCCPCFLPDTLPYRKNLQAKPPSTKNPPSQNTVGTANDFKGPERPASRRDPVNSEHRTELSQPESRKRLKSANATRLVSSCARVGSTKSTKVRSRSETRARSQQPNVVGSCERVENFLIDEIERERMRIFSRTDERWESAAPVLDGVWFRFGMACWLFFEELSLRSWRQRTGGQNEKYEMK